MSEKRAPVVKASDMSDELQNEAHEVAAQAMKSESEKDIATIISGHFNRKYHPTWHCIVGRNFAANFSHENKNFHYFYIGQTGILLWKAG